MWQNPHETADLVTFTEEILNGKLHFSASDFFLYIPLPRIKEYRRLKKVIHQTVRK